MAKFHIAKDGRPAECKAHRKACPLGEATPHGEFESPEEAVAWAEAVHSKNAGGTFSKRKKVAPAQKLYELPDVRLPYLEEGESLEETGWVVQQMLTEEGRIDEVYIDENEGFPESFRDLVFERQADGTYTITGPEEPLEAWMNEDEEPGELREVTEKASVLPKDLANLEGTPFEEVANFELRKAYDGDNGYRKMYRSAPTYNVSEAAAVPPELWTALAEEAEAEYGKVNEERRGYAEEMRKSEARFPPTPKGMREAEYKARQLRALSTGARNAAYISSRKKLSTGDVLEPGEILVDATFDKKGNLLGYGDTGRTDVDGVEVRFSPATSRKGSTVHGVVAVKGVIERGQVVAASRNIKDARILKSSTAVNISDYNPFTEPVETWTLGDHTYHGTVHGQAYFNFKPFREGGVDSFIPEY